MGNEDGGRTPSPLLFMNRNPFPNVWKGRMKTSERTEIETRPCGLEQRVNHPPAKLWLFLPVLLLAGCSKTPAAKVAPPVVKAKAGMDESLKTAMELLRQATTPQHYRDALNLVDQYLVKHGDSLKIPDKKALARLAAGVGLAEADLGNLTAVNFRPEDVPYIESCFWFRDAARALEMPLASSLEQTQLCLDWTCRNLLLHEQGDDALPPLLALRRGFGAERDRALVFLHLLRQFEIEGCLVEVAADPKAPHLLAGVLTEGNNELNVFLFDPRSGRAVPGPKTGTILTIQEALDRPELLGGDSKDGRGVPIRVRMVGPISAMTPRMRFLENQFLGQEKIVLHQDAGRLLDSLQEKAADALVPWPTEGNGWSPLRSWQGMLPKTDGGSDLTNRLARYRFGMLPWPVIAGRFAQLRLYNDLPEPGRNALMGLTGDLLVKYLQQPEEYLVRGRYDDAFSRLNRIGNALEDLSLAAAGEAAFAKEVAQWREHLNEAYAALLRKENGAQGRVNALWVEDQYFQNLLDPENEIPPNRYRRGTLTRVVLHATRPVLSQQSSWLTARCWEEKAERAEALLQRLRGAKKPEGSAEEAARSAWNNTRANWNRYVDRHGLGRTTEGRLQTIRDALDRGELETAVVAWERLHLDLHRSLAARKRLARAWTQLHELKKENRKQPRAALDALREAAQEASLARNHPTWKKELERTAEQLRSMHPLLAQRLDLLLRDFAPEGPLADLEASGKNESIP